MTMTEYLKTVLHIENIEVSADAEPSFTYVFEKEEE